MREYTISAISFKLATEKFEETIVLEGTDKQCDYAYSLIQKKIESTNATCNLMVNKGKMTYEQYVEGMKGMLKDMATRTDAKWVIEHVK